MHIQKENVINRQLIEIKSMLLSACEELCNRALRYDEASRQAFAQLEGKTISVCTYIDLPFARPELVFSISFCENGLIFSNLNESHLAHEGAIDAEITASSFQLFSRLLSQKGLLDGEIEIKGNRALVSKVQSILFNLDLDWEEPLSNITGDIVAHELNRFAQDASRWIKNSGSFFETLFEKGIKNSSSFISQPSIIEKDDLSSFQQDVADLKNLQEKISTRANHFFSKHKINETQSAKTTQELD